MQDYVSDSLDEQTARATISKCNEVPVSLAETLDFCFNGSDEDNCWEVDMPVELENDHLIDSVLFKHEAAARQCKACARELSEFPGEVSLMSSGADVLEGFERERLV